MITYAKFPHSETPTENRNVNLSYGNNHLYSRLGEKKKITVASGLKERKKIAVTGLLDLTRISLRSYFSYAPNARFAIPDPRIYTPL